MQRVGQRVMNVPLHPLVSMAVEVKCQVHPIGLHPRDPEVSIRPLAQVGGDASDGVAGHIIDVNRNEETFHSVSQRRTISSAACDA